MLYRETPPSPLLAPYVECFWTARTDGPTPFRPREILIPDGTTELMLNFGGPYRRFAASHGDSGEDIARSHIIGIRRTGVFIEQRSDQNVFSIRFRLGGLYPFLRIPMSEFTQRSIDLDAVLGALAADLEDRVVGAESPEAQVRIVEAVLLRRLQSEERIERRLHHALRLIYATRGRVTVDEIGNALALSYKALDRAFSRYVGLPPKRVCRVVRFNNALSLMQRRGGSGLTTVAYQAGYADQAHMIRDFKEFTDTTPREFLLRRYAIVEVTEATLRERLSNSYNSGR